MDMRSSALVFFLFCLSSPAFGADQPMSSTQFWTSTLWFFALGLGAYYFLVTAPTLKKQQERKRFLDELKRNDEVMTSGGIFGRVVATSPEFVTVEIASGVKVRVATAHVQAVARIDATGQGEKGKAASGAQ